MIRYGASVSTPGIDSGPTFHNATLISAPANSTTALPSASSSARPAPASVDTMPAWAPVNATGLPNASARMSSRPPMATARIGETASNKLKFTAPPHSALEQLAHQPSCSDLLDNPARAGRHVGP